MKRIIFNSFLLLCLMSAQSQDPNGVQLPQIIPPNPVAMQYQKFVGYPVDASTGLVNISVPLYNLQLPGITIPFSLKYHASGIKVEEPYGSLGYGWSFFPGFRITRTVMGKLDEYYHTDNIQSQYTATVHNYTDYLANMATPASENDESNTTADGQFDIFTIHLPTFDGGFILKWENNALKAMPIPDAPLKISIVSAGGSGYIGGFNVTDDKGIQYLFGNAYSATNNEYSEGNDLYASGWMPRKIILPGVNDTLLFHYNMVGAPNLSPSCNSIILYDNFKSNVAGDASSLQSQLGMSGGCGSYVQSSASYCGFTGTLRSFQSVEFSTGKAVVSYASNSIAMIGMAVLNSQQDTVKKITFSQQNQLLTGVAISGEGEYSFSYNPQRIINIQENNTTYFAVYQQDRWGFFNNKRNTSLIPAITLATACDGGSGYVTGGTANREVDTSAMQADMLQQITYPTGGRTNFFYESHKFGSYYSPVLGGGLRIKQMDTYDPVSGKTITKTYKYGTNETGIGTNSGFYPSDDSFIEENYLYTTSSGFNARCRRRTVNQHSKWRFFGFNLPVWYSEVTEYSDGGKTVYDYDYAQDVINTAYPSIGYDFNDNPSFSHLTDVLQYSNNIMMGAPSLIKKRIYKSDSNTYTLLHEDDYGYAAYNATQVHGLIVDPLAYVVLNGQPPRNNLWDSAHYNIYGFSSDGVSQTLSPFTYYDYYISAGKNNLYSTTQHDYSNGNDIAMTIMNDYDNAYPYNLTSTQQITSKGDTLTQKYYYPTNSSIPDSSALSSSQRQMVRMLKDSNRVTTLIQRSSFKNGSTHLFSSLYGYKNWGNGVLQPEQTYTKTGSKAYESRLRFYSYDDKGNTLSVSKENDIKMIYLWGYNKTYPVAQITGADYTDVSAIINPSILNNPQSDQQLRSELDKLRTGLPQAQVVAYTYNPLVGITSVTNINGLTNYYEYDSFKRLKLIRDQDGNIIKTFSYQYKEQQ